MDYLLYGNIFYLYRVANSINVKIFMLKKFVKYI